MGFVRVFVKFRFLGFDLGAIDKTFRVSASAQGVSGTESGVIMPADAKKLVDQRGVRLWVW